LVLCSELVLCIKAVYYLRGARRYAPRFRPFRPVGNEFWIKPFPSDRVNRGRVDVCYSAQEQHHAHILSVEIVR
jgi:hypothetical protein